MAATTCQEAMLGSAVWVGARPRAYRSEQPACMRAVIRSVAALLLTRNAVSVSVHQHAGTMRQKLFGFFTRRHLRAVFSSIATETARRRRRCARRRFTRAVRSGASVSPSLLLSGVQFFERGIFSNLFGGTRALLIRHRSIDDALVQRRGLKHGHRHRETCNRNSKGFELQHEDLSLAYSKG